MFFDCDQRGRRTRCSACGVRNSNNGFERPFLILSSESWNTQNNNDGIYALPLTKSGKGNVYSYTVGKDTFDDMQVFNQFKDSIILCDKVCRISKKDLSPGVTTKVKMKYAAYNTIKNSVKKFMDMEFGTSN